MFTFEDLLDGLVLDNDKRVGEGYYISSKLFTRFYLEKQNKITRKGRVVSPIWENIGDGVYKVSIKD